MPRPNEVAEIVVNGTRYQNWQSVQVSRSVTEAFSSFAFTSASPIESGINWSNLKLRIGDRCQVRLAGTKVIDGQIWGRQPAFDAYQHGLQITGSSTPAIFATATVDHAKGEFRNSTLSQILNSVFAPFKIKFKLDGDAEGADIPFDRVNVQVGETIFTFADRLCRMRNIFLTDDAEGNVIGFRLKSATGVIADLQEGRNIKTASGVFNYIGAYSEIQANGQRPGTDQNFGDDARDVSAKVLNPAVQQKVILRFMAEMPGTQKEMELRAQRELAANIENQVNVQIVTQGWHRDDGSLWLENVGKLVSVYSPMLLTDDRRVFGIRAVTSSQADGVGTTTTIELVLPTALGGLDAIDANGPASTGGA